MYHNITRNPIEMLLFLTPRYLTGPPPLNLDLPRDDGSNTVSVVGNESSSSHLDATKCAVSHEDSSEITEQTRITIPRRIDNNDHVHEVVIRGPTLGFDKKGKGLYDLHRLEGMKNRLADRVSNVRVLSNTQSLADDKDDAPAFESAEANADKDRLAAQPQQCIGPGRYDEPLGGSGTHRSQGPDRNNLSILEVHTSLERPDESTSEARKVIQRVERLSALEDPATTRDAQAADTPPHGAGAASGPSVPVTDELGHGPLPGLTNAEPAQMEAGMRASSSSVTTSRQTRINQHNGTIHRLKPRAGVIYFNVDAESFLRARISEDVIHYITHEARRVAREFNARDLGIRFAYAPENLLKVFSIRYDPALPRKSIAAAFFPCDKREKRQVRISTIATLSSSDGGFLEYMNNILSHEFAHILGFRHWNARLEETGEESLLWPDTVDEARDTIMNTNVHPSLLQFSDEDYWVIKELYSKPNGAEVPDGGVNRVIEDVDP